MPPRYKEVEKCREEIQEYVEELDVGTEDADPDKRKEVSTNRYKQDLRWYDEWLDEQGIESVLDVDVPDTSRLGRTLANEFSGTTSLYRWNRIYRFHDWLVAMEVTTKNPMKRWDDQKDEKWGLTRRTQQSKELGEEERYAPSQDEIRMMEENVGRNRIRDQLIIRLLWQTGMRRGEASGLRLDDIDREAREIHIRASNAKNDRARYVAYQPSLDGLLSTWIDGGHRDEMLGVIGDEEDPHDRLLVGERGAPLSGDRINKIIIEAADRAGLNRKMYGDSNAPVDPETGKPKKNRWKITAHNIRHGYGSYMVHDAPEDDEEVRLWEISRQMGHSSVEITEDIYVEEDPRAGISYAHSHGPD